jgi:HlyD family secretion protein
MGLAVLSLAGCAKSGAPVYSGTVEGTEIAIQSEVSGAVTELPVPEGSEVKKGQVLVRIDDSLYRAQVQEARAGVDAALAAFDEAKAGSRSQEIVQAMAGVDQARAMTEQATQKAKSAADQVQVLRANQAQVQQLLEGAKQTLAYQQQQLDRTQALFESGAASRQQVDALQEAVRQAQTQVNQLQAQLETIAAQIRQAQDEQAAAEAQQASAKAAEQAAQAKLDLLRAGTTDQRLRQLLAQKEQADARLAQAQVQLDKTTVRAPADGILLRKEVEIGEVVKPGSVLYTLLKKGELKVVIYVPEAELSRVHIGQAAQIRVDAYPGRTFGGKVTTISDRAEFTPKNVQTSDERTKMVFAVTVQITEGLDVLKPGMPADVTLAVQEGGGK